MRVIQNCLIALIQFLRNPLFGPALCLFSPTCTQFACQQLQEKSLLAALLAISKRLLSCNSFTR